MFYIIFLKFDNVLYSTILAEWNHTCLGSLVVGNYEHIFMKSFSKSCILFITFGDTIPFLAITKLLYTKLLDYINMVLSNGIISYVLYGSEKDII